MSDPNDFQEHIRQLERELHSTRGSEPPLRSADPELTRVYRWVNSLTGVSKVMAVVVIGIVSFIVIGFFLQLLWQAITLGVFIAICYVLWKLFFDNSPSSPE